MSAMTMANERTETTEDLDQRNARWQKERIERAASADYLFTYHSGIAKWACDKRDGSLPYILTEEECSCPDDCYRMRPRALACKHRVSLAVHLLLTGRKEASK